MTERHLMECDGCGRTVPTAESDDWFVVRQNVATQERLRQLQTIVQDGTDPLYHVEVCSLPCLASWAGTAAEVAALETGLQ